VNTTLHYVIPAAAVIDWFLDPPQHRFGWTTAVAWLAYPLAWFAYTLGRGGATGWYPYPFVDVSQHGYGRVLLNALVFLAAFAVGALGLARLAAWRMRQSTAVALPSPGTGG
jgi:hypothetical protein